MSVLAKVRVGCAVAVLAGVGFGWPAPAAADPAGLAVVGVTSASNNANKVMTAFCPAGTVVTGGGGYLTTSPAAAGHVGLIRLEPLAGGGGFTAAMRVTDGFGGNWAMTSKAACVTPPAGYQVVATTGLVEQEYVTADCLGKTVIGMGGRINNGMNSVVLDQVVPSFGLSTVTVRGVPVAGTNPVGWTVTAYAVCATQPAGVERLALIGAASGNDHQFQVVSCPAGKALYSAGADINGANGAALLSGVNIAPDDTVRVWADGSDPNWSVSAYGVCG